MDGMTEARTSPSGRGRNYTPLGKKWCNCALPGGVLRTADDCHGFSIRSNHHRGKFPLRWLLPAIPLWTYRLKASCVASHFQPASKKSIPFVRLLIYNRDSDKLEFVNGKRD